LPANARADSRRGCSVAFAGPGQNPESPCPSSSPTARPARSRGPTWLAIVKKKSASININ